MDAEKKLRGPFVLKRRKSSPVKIGGGAVLKIGGRSVMGPDSLTVLGPGQMIGPIDDAREAVRICQLLNVAYNRGRRDALEGGASRLSSGSVRGS